MTFEVNVRQDLKRLQNAFDLYPKEVMAAGLRARNRSMTSVAAASARRIQPELAGIKIGTIKRQLAQRRATPSDPRAILEFSARRFRVYGNVALRETVTKWGTGARLGKMPFRLELADGTPVTQEQLQRLFIQRSRAGRVNVWVREGKAREPFQAVLVPSLAAVFRERGVGVSMTDLWRERFRAVFIQEARFRLSKRI